MKNKQGIAHILIFLLVVVIAVVLVLMQLSQRDSVVEETSVLVSPAPISDSTDLDVIEEELNATELGSPDEEINVMSEDASSL